MTKKIFFLLLLANFLVFLGARYLVPPLVDESRRFSGGSIEFLTSAERADLVRETTMSTASLDAESTEETTESVTVESFDPSQEAPEAVAATETSPATVQTVYTDSESAPDETTGQYAEEISQTFSSPTQEQTGDQISISAPLESDEQARRLAQDLIPDLDPAQVREEILERTANLIPGSGAEPLPESISEPPPEPVEESGVAQEAAPIAESAQAANPQPAAEPGIDEVSEIAEAPKPEVVETPPEEAAQLLPSGPQVVQVAEPEVTQSVGSDLESNVAPETITEGLKGSEAQQFAEKEEESIPETNAAETPEREPASEQADEMPSEQESEGAADVTQEQESADVEERATAEVAGSSEPVESSPSQTGSAESSTQPLPPAQDQEPVPELEQTQPEETLGSGVDPVQESTDEQAASEESESADSAETQNPDEGQTDESGTEDVPLPVQEETSPPSVDEISQVEQSGNGQTAAEDLSDNEQSPSAPRVGDQGCRTLGPFEDRASAETFAQDLAARDLPGLLRTGALRETRSYLVLIPTASKEDAADTMRRLLGAGYKDVWLLTTGEHKGKVSVGLFRSDSNADSRLSQVTNDGFPATIVPRIVERPAFWVDLDVEPSRLVTPELMEELRETYPQVSNEPGRCPGSSL